MWRKPKKNKDKLNVNNQMTNLYDSKIISDRVEIYNKRKFNKKK